MLYDILSPFIFFLSLGGILLIIGRVVIRIRREQFSSSLSAMHEAGASDKGLSTSFGTREVSNVLRPNQKSVQAIRNRLSYVTHLIAQSGRDIRSMTQRLKRRPQAEEQVASAAEEPVVSVPQVDTTPPAPLAEDFLAPESEQVITPPTASRWARVFGGSRRLFRRQSADVSSPDSVAGPINAPAMPEATPEGVSEEESSAAPSRRWRLRRVRRAPEATAENHEPAVEPATPEVIPADSSQPTESSPVPALPKKRRSLNHALRRGHVEKPMALPAPLAEATAALSQRQFRQAEDLLVPYIVKHPKDTVAYMLLGQAAVGRKAWLEAMEIYEQVITWNAHYEGAYAALGYAAYRARRFTRALQAFQRAHEAAPTDTTILEYLLSIAQKMDNPALQHSITEKLADLARAEAVTAPKTKTRAGARV